MRRGVTDAGQTNERTVKIELLSQWKLEAESRKISMFAQTHRAIILAIMKDQRLHFLIFRLCKLNVHIKVYNNIHSIHIYES